MKTIQIYNGERVALSDIPVVEYGEFCEGIVSLLREQSRHCVNYFAVGSFGLRPQDDAAVILNVREESPGDIRHSEAEGRRISPNICHSEAEGRRISPSIRHSEAEGRRISPNITLFCCIADDSDSTIHVVSSVVNPATTLHAISAEIPAMERFEREIAENYGVEYEGHPWMKPVRYSHDRADSSKVMDNYPFYAMESEELHEVGVGPVHAGVIEPGHFRFICDGEKILHLEIQLGYQHRGVERLMVERKKLLERCMLAESVAGDTAVGHSIAFATVYESLAGFGTPRSVILERMIALEMERAAIHTGDLSAICGDVAYQLGNAVFGRLRTPLINFMQQWSGNRLGKGCIRPAFSPFRFTEKHEAILLDIFAKYEHDFNNLWHKVSKMPSTLGRLEKTGVVSLEQAQQIGAVGMAARASGLERDVRSSHPFLAYACHSEAEGRRTSPNIRHSEAEGRRTSPSTRHSEAEGRRISPSSSTELGSFGQSPQDDITTIPHTPIVKHHGDVYSRTQIRHEEILQSFEYIRRLMTMLREARAEEAHSGNYSDKYNNLSVNNIPLETAPDSFSISLVEGWRGEICHCAITGHDGNIVHYKIKDPSFHNWMALALAVRGNEISDFPICNKSFNLSYCGHDL